MEVTDRVHVVAHGWEVARVVDPLYKLKADKIVLVLPDNEAFIPDFEYEMIEELEANDRIEVETRTANLYDLDSALQTITQAVKDHEEDEVYINVSTGTQIAAIAGMMAAQTSEATPFYVQITPDDADEDEVWTPDEPIFSTSGEITELPVFELQGPSTEQLQILGFLHGNDGVTKKELIEHAEEEELPFIMNTEAKSDEGRYRVLDSHIINPLTENEYITVEKAGRKKEVSITQRGIDALAAFPLDSETMEAVENRPDGDVREMRSKAFNPDLESMTSRTKGHHAGLDDSSDQD
ncbi:hypothetical protein EGH24_02005 [Halonotius terrestris]|uniref:Uncharacterized protein n=1 Tax=Halonotius terrestris TaxID=2487750 RepID=A0A8J8TDW7_9EURY|nr:DUF6293 family protein [Halonotius terrestris]TQQ83589.1 hypothetical protein EGH24_02005 [Halonotius terrestris]